jgi:hypothetical protein
MTRRVGRLDRRRVGARSLQVDPDRRFAPCSGVLPDRRKTVVHRVEIFFTGNWLHRRAPEDPIPARFGVFGVNAIRRAANKYFIVIGLTKHN